MNLPSPPSAYNPQDQAQTRTQISREDKRNLKKGQDVDIGAAMLILTSPNGTRFKVVVANDGTLSATSL